MTRTLERKRGRLGGGSIMPYAKGGYAAYTWMLNVNGVRVRKWVYGQVYEEVYLRWKRLQVEASDMHAPPRPRIIDELALSIVCDERVPMCLTGVDRIEAIRRLTAKGCDSPEIARLLKCTVESVTRARSYHSIHYEDREVWSWEKYMYGSRRHHAKPRESK